MRQIYRCKYAFAPEAIKKMFYKFIGFVENLGMA